MSVVPTIICTCSEIIAKSVGGEAKIRSKILIVKAGGVFAVCKSCGQEVRVPLRPEPTLQIDLQPGPPLVLRK